MCSWAQQSVTGSEEGEISAAGWSSLLPAIETDTIDRNVFYFVQKKLQIKFDSVLL